QVRLGRQRDLLVRCRASKHRIRMRGCYRPVVRRYGIQILKAHRWRLFKEEHKPGGSLGQLPRRQRGREHQLQVRQRIIYSQAKDLAATAHHDSVAWCVLRWTLDGEGMMIVEPPPGGSLVKLRRQVVEMLQYLGRHRGDGDQAGEWLIFAYLGFHLH